jgi:hypothetical protein
MKNYTDKNLSTLVEDIYNTISDLNSGNQEISEACLESLSVGVSNAVKGWATPKENKQFTLRMSNVGKPARQLYYNNKYNNSNDLDSPTLIKFLYGHILEEVLIFLVKLAGHTVTDEQKEVILNDVKGHIDCKIDGEVVDIKTASSFAFKKFKNGTLREDDPFGYLSQLAGYETAEGTSNGGFLVINKESGELTLYRPEDLDKPNVKVLINKIKDIFKFDELPERCYNLAPSGTKGNMKLPRGCVYCHFKTECHSDANGGKGLRLFKYAKGIEYLTRVNYLPKVEEIAA